MRGLGRCPCISARPGTRYCPLRLDDLNIVAHLDLTGRVDRRDPPVGDDDRLVLQHDRATRPGHRQHGDTHERHVALDHWQRVATTDRHRDGERYASPGAARHRRPARSHLVVPHNAAWMTATGLRLQTSDALRLRMPADQMRATAGRASDPPLLLLLPALCLLRPTPRARAVGSSAARARACRP